MIIRLLLISLVSIAPIAFAETIDDASKYADALASAKNGDFESALPIWQELAVAGYAPAQVEIGRAYAVGTGVERD